MMWRCHPTVHCYDDTIFRAARSCMRADMVVNPILSAWPIQ
ncbi:hypothetical protein [Methylosinus sporium]|nr:hypothetical protein [Methylosinus sporium]